MDRMTERLVSCWSGLERGAGRKPVWIDYERLEEVMEEHTPHALATTSHLPPIPGVSSQNPFVAASYILTGNIWNFGFKTPSQPHYRVANPENPDKPFEGFMAFYQQLYQRLGENVITADMIRPHVESVDAMREFFHGLNDIPMPELRQRCGLDFVRVLDQRYKENSLMILRDVASDGTFRAFGNGHGLVETLVGRFPIAYGEDYRVLDSKIYRFDKRARLVAMLFQQYAINSGGTLIRPLEDIDDLGPALDYQMPRILHAPHVRVLLYSQELDRAIEDGVEIPRGSFEECMIRMGTAAALVHWSEKKNIPIGSCLDPYLFSISRGLPNKAHYTGGSDY